MVHAAETARQIAIQVLRSGSVKNHKGVDMAAALEACAPVSDRKTAIAACTLLLECESYVTTGRSVLSSCQHSIESVTYGQSSQVGLDKAIAKALEMGIEVQS